MSGNCYRNARLQEAIQIFKVGSVLAGGCEVQAFKLYTDNIKMSSTSNTLLKIKSNLFS